MVLSGKNKVYTITVETLLFFFFRVWGSMVYTLLSGPMVYTLFPCFPRKIVYTIAFFALWPRGQATDREKRCPTVVVHTRLSPVCDSTTVSLATLLDRLGKIAFAICRVPTPLHPIDGMKPLMTLLRWFGRTGRNIPHYVLTQWADPYRNQRIVSLHAPTWEPGSLSSSRSLALTLPHPSLTWWWVLEFAFGTRDDAPVIKPLVRYDVNALFLAPQLQLDC